ncbi:MAG TPA: gamma-glutamyltransferase [Burkholderiales bacterium]|nr:gamma-glutamyltransferase [Burkholderiales bacterium]
MSPASSNRRQVLLAALLSAALLICGPGVAAQQAGGAAIASAHPLATAAGHEILKQGGNAFDAAVAVAAALAVVEPYSSGLGGGGFWLLHRARDGFEVMVDGRETAPRQAVREIFLDASGKPGNAAIAESGKAAAIPGTPAALAHVARTYGRLPLAASLAPAIRYAREGFPADPRYVRIATLRERRLQSHPDTARIFLVDGRAPMAGHVLRQPELGGTLAQLAAAGAGGFYDGAVARALVESVNGNGGVWQLSDLAEYRVVERAPVRFQYRGATITAAALPSAGGIALAQTLNMLERYTPGDARAPGAAHYVIEAMRRAFHDRARFLGDPDFVPVPVDRLVSKDYARRRAAGINPASATPSDALGEERIALPGSFNTTHLSVIDADGNRVAATLTVNWLFGSGIVAGTTGVLLNNEMDDFSFDPDVPNSYRLHGSHANAVAPGKRPLSSMTPAFVEDSKGVLVLGAPGGPRIVSQVLLAILDYLETSQGSLDLERIVRAPRYHHQWWPDRVEIEPGAFPPEWRAALEAMGHRLQPTGRAWGNMQLVFKSKATGIAQSANDPRGEDVGWY